MYDRPPSVHYSHGETASSGSQRPFQQHFPIHPHREYSAYSTVKPWRGDESVANQHRLPEQPAIHHSHQSAQHQEEPLNAFFPNNRQSETASVQAHTHQDFQPAVSSQGILGRVFITSIQPKVYCKSILSSPSPVPGDGRLKQPHNRKCRVEP